ncbi:hypothetical protein PLICRDRAFT_105538 [Plicaturopsis crispa FD-325 SS-3]|nr:hypothetical protein PLICRDRAFT_105538 [Plicaturopsis crispa FD-325 SS-3]
MPSEFPVLARLLSSNFQWAEDVADQEPEFFAQTAKGQSPKVLWIGCADSRVPETVITASKPGDIFVHRNIANQFRLDDESAQSILAYAVDHVGVEHVIVVGHTGCGGASACFAACGSVDTTGPPAPIVTIPSVPADAPLNTWLAPLTFLAATLPPQRQSLDALVEENVKAQVATLTQAETIANVWADDQGGKKVWVHGWVYDLATGRLKDLEVTVGPPE